MYSFIVLLTFFKIANKLTNYFYKHNTVKNILMTLGFSELHSQSLSRINDLSLLSYCK